MHMLTDSALQLTLKLTLELKIVYLEIPIIIIIMFSSCIALFHIAAQSADVIYAAS